MQSEKYGSEECCKDVFSFLVETMEIAVKSWHEKSTVDAIVYFLLDKEKTDTDKYAPVVNIDKVNTTLCVHNNLIFCYVHMNPLFSLLKMVACKLL